MHIPYPLGMVKSISKIYQNLKCMPPLASTRFSVSICVLFWGPESTGYAFLGYQKTKGFATGYAFLGPGVQWICCFGIGPESNGHAFLGYQKTKGFATGYAFLGPGVQWICFFGARSPMDMLFWDTRKLFFFLKGICHWICFFGARSPIFCIYLYQATTCKSVQVEK